MRWLPIALVLVALAFTTGGVRADSKDGSAAPNATPAAGPNAAPASADQCAAPAVPQKMTLRRDPNRSRKTIVLNTRGYNYSTPGEWRPSPTAQPQGVPEGVLPPSASQAPAPEKSSAPPAAAAPVAD